MTINRRNSIEIKPNSCKEIQTQTDDFIAISPKNPL